MFLFEAKTPPKILIGGYIIAIVEVLFALIHRQGTMLPAVVAILCGTLVFFPAIGIFFLYREEKQQKRLFLYEIKRSIRILIGGYIIAIVEVLFALIDRYYIILPVEAAILCGILVFFPMLGIFFLYREGKQQKRSDSSEK